VINKRNRAIIFLAIAATLWSTAGLFIKWIPTNPIALSGMRSGIAFVVILMYWFARYKTRLPRPSKAVIFGAVNYAVLVMLFVSANKLTTSANAILLQFTAPVWILLIGRFFYKEKVHSRDILTVIIVFFGMSLFFVGKLEIGGMVGNVLAVISGICMGIMIVNLNKLKNHNPIEIIIWGNLIMFIIGMPFLGGVSLNSKAIAGILALGIFQLGISYVFYTAGIQDVTPLEGILIPVIEPLLNPIWVLVFMDEKPTVFSVIGGLVVMVAVVLRNVLLVIDNRNTNKKKNIESDYIYLQQE
jgi:drug/metabolite transporter (DMT)-like permease